MNQKEEIAALRSELSELRKSVDDLRRFQSWLTGGLGVLGVIAAFLADKFKKVLGL